MKTSQRRGLTRLRLRLVPGTVAVDRKRPARRGTSYAGGTGVTVRALDCAGLAPRPAGSGDLGPVPLGPRRSFSWEPLRLGLRLCPDQAVRPQCPKLNPATS
jgi:hypothetical protein